MDFNPLISVIVPIYNVDKYLSQCIDSVLHQSYKNIEIILINDGSTDNSANICNNYLSIDNRIKVFHISNSGSSVARNIGFTKSEGELVVFLDGDDFWCGYETLKNVVDKFLSDSSKNDFVLFKYKKFYQNDNKYLHLPDIKKICTIINNTHTKKGKLQVLTKSGLFPLSTWDKLIKREFLINNNIEFIPDITHQDLAWSIELFQKCNSFFIVDDCLYVYRKQVNGAITSSFSEKKYFDLLFIIENTINKFENEDKESDLKDLFLCFMAYHYSILIALTANYSGKRFYEVVDILSKYKWLLKYGNSYKIVLTRICVQLLGFRLTALILRYYIRRFVNKNH